MVCFHKCRRVDVVGVRQWVQECSYYCDLEDKVTLSETQDGLVLVKVSVPAALFFKGTKY